MFSLYSQPYGADGGVDARSVTNAIGRTRLNLAELVFRESLQNSWDAKINDSISFVLDEKTLSDHESTIIFQRIFKDLPPSGKCVALRRLAGSRLRVLMISDSGTAGLGGPIRADIAANGKPTDFVDFVRNVGRGENKGFKGGTYGLGKGVLFNASKLGLCLVYSQSRENGAIEPRLIGLSGADPDYEFEGRRYTGRNWWGERGLDDIVDPMIGDKARLLAAEIGMRVPSTDLTGTTIMIIDPVEGDGQTPDSLMEGLRSAALKWAWPLAIPSASASQSVHFEFFREGQALPGIDPIQTFPYSNFVKSYIDVGDFESDPDSKTNWKVNCQTILQKNPRRNLGTLSIRRPSSKQSEEHELDNTVALMRNPRIVVKYLDAPVHPSGEASHGVFVVQPDADYFFAQSEPVAHDDWISEDVKDLDGKRTNPVRIAYRELSSALKQYSSNAINPSGSDEASGLSNISARLGSLLSGFSGSGAEFAKSAPSRGVSSLPNRTRKKTTVVAVAGPKLELRNGNVVVRQEFEIRGGTEGGRIVLGAQAQIINESGAAEGVDDTNETRPSFIEWNIGDEVLKDRSITADLPTSQNYSVIFTQPVDTAISISVHFEEEVYA